jgi:hypothetical protein
VTFSQNAFANPVGAENGTDAPAQALRDFIASATPPVPATGWRSLARTDEFAVFQTGRPSSGIAVTFQLVDGVWRQAGFGCSAHRVVPGYVVDGLQLEPSGLRRSARSFVVQIQDGVCPSSTFGSLQVLETSRTVMVVALMRPGPPLPPNVACPALLRLIPKRVRLSRPLGRRVVRDASSFPARVLGRATK